MWKTTVVSSTASTESSMLKSASEFGVASAVLNVNATSDAVRGSPSVNFTSSRMWNVHVSPSSLTL